MYIGQGFHREYFRMSASFYSLSQSDPFLPIDPVKFSISVQIIRRYIFGVFVPVIRI
jgi:hypothetical protein